VTTHEHTGYPLDGLVVLLGLSRDIGIHLDLDTLLRRVETAALRVLECERLTVFMTEPLSNQLRSRLATGVREIRTPIDRGIAGATMVSGQLINVPDVTKEPRFNPDIDRETGFQTRSLLSLPLRGIDNDIIGVLQLLNKADGPFTAIDEELAQTLAALTAMTLQRHILFEHWQKHQQREHDLELARRIQRSLLPVDDPSPAGFDIAAWTEPADVIGGDFYDYFTLTDGRVAMVVADVAGHGLAASLLACETRALIRGAVGSSPTLVDIVMRANEVLYRDLQNERFVIMFAAALDAASGRLEYVAAGCGPFLYRDAERDVIAADSSMPPLGIFEHAPADAAREILLQPGDALVVATDGFYEWENEQGEEFGLEQVAEIIQTYATVPAPEIVQYLHDAVERFAGSVKQADDLTAMVIKRDL
jgi:phosphoserine phosphatase